MPSRHLRHLFSFSSLRIAAAQHPSTSRHPPRKPLIIALTATALGLLTVVVVLFLYWYRRLLNKQRSNKTSPDDGAAFKLRKFKYRQLKRATKSFSQSQRLGKGGFGVVYRGVLRDGKEVAVKKLDLSSLQGEREFQNELTICGGLSSPYVVSLLGYCIHGRRVRLLVYECMHNRSLQEALFEKGYPVHLDWEKRYKIIVDTAKALDFLHLQCSPPVIHGDVKPSNILLDRQFSARIADFGLARVKTEDLGLDSARLSTSTEKCRPDNASDRFRFGTPDRFAPGTPEMSRSSTKNALSESSVKAFTEILPESRNVTEKPVVIDIPPTEAPRSPDDAIDGDMIPISPNFSQSSGQPGVSENLADEAVGTIRSFAATDVIPGYLNKQNSSVQEDGAEASDEQGKAYPLEGCTKEDTASGEELQLRPPNRQLSFKKVSGKDWWWRQDTSGDLGGKEYVMDWIGSELHGSSRRNVSSKDGEIVPVEENRSVGREQKSRFRPSEASGEASGEIISIEAKKKDKRKAKAKQRKSREWWKDEYFAELSSKNKSARLAKGKRDSSTSLENWKDYHSGDLSGYSGELRRFTKERFYNRSKEWLRDYHSGDLSLCRGRERRSRAPSVVSDTWSGDLLHRQFSGDLLNRQWSGDLTKSGELVSRDVSSTTSMRGTVCYVAPEYGGSGILSEKGDIYSFGVLMLVILSGRRPIQVTASPMKEFERANLISWARSLSQSGKLLELMDEMLHGDYNREQANLCITLALLCLQRVPARRPNISEIVKILLGETSAPSLPLELSPSPPARRSYKSPLRPPMQRSPVAETP